MGSKLQEKCMEVDWSQSYALKYLKINRDSGEYAD